MLEKILTNYEMRGIKKQLLLGFIICQYKSTMSTQKIIIDSFLTSKPCLIDKYIQN